MVISLTNSYNVQEPKHTNKLETNINAPTTFVNQLAPNLTVALSKVYGIWNSVDHFIDSCPALQQDITSPDFDTPQAYAVNILNNNKS